MTEPEELFKEAVEEISVKPAAPVEEKDEVGSSQRDKLIACAAAAELWHDADGTGYATLAVGGHAEHYLLRSKGFRLWLGYRYYTTYKGATGAQAMQDAMAALEAKARFEGEKHELAVRIAHHEGNIYVDLADDDWRAIEITPRGWSVVSCPPVRFVRPRGLRPLPVPKERGSLDDLERFLNVRTEGDLKLVLGWLVMAFNPRGPYPPDKYSRYERRGISNADVLKRLVDAIGASGHGKVRWDWLLNCRVELMFGPPANWPASLLRTEGNVVHVNFAR